MIGIGAAGTVPIAFVDADHASGVAGDAVVREEIGRVGENQVHAAFGNGGEDFKAIALKDFDVMLFVVEDWRGQLGLSGGRRHFATLSASGSGGLRRLDQGVK